MHRTTHPYTHSSLNFTYPIISRIKANIITYKYHESMLLTIIMTANHKISLKLIRSRTLMKGMYEAFVISTFFSIIEVRKILFRPLSILFFSLFLPDYGCDYDYDYDCNNNNDNNNNSNDNKKKRSNLSNQM